jgi:hypothetical protein
MTPFVPIRVTESIELQRSDEEPWEGYSLQQSESFLEHITQPLGKVFSGAGPVDELSYLQGPTLDSTGRHLGLRGGAAAISKIYEEYNDPARKDIGPSQISCGAAATPVLPDVNISTFES